LTKESKQPWEHVTRQTPYEKMTGTALAVRKWRCFSSWYNRGSDWQGTGDRQQQGQPQTSEHKPLDRLCGGVLDVTNSSKIDGVETLAQ
jgi:hypothetical protein